MEDLVTSINTLIEKDKGEGPGCPSGRATQNPGVVTLKVYQKEQG